jgi:hypothetical protein
VSERIINVSYKSWAGLQRDCQQQIALRGLFLKTVETLPQFVRVCLKLTAPNGAQVELRGEVVQSMPGRGLAVQFASDAANAITQLNVWCQSNSGASKEPPDAMEPMVQLEGGAGIAAPPKVPVPAAEAGKPDQPSAAAIPTPVPDAAAAQPAQEPEIDPANLAAQVEAMSVDEKRKTALHGRRDMRLLLIRDRNKTIHPFVVKNPSITLDEIEQIAKMPGVNPETLRIIAASLEWTRSATVCRNLIFNPNCPMREALTLLSRLPQGDLRAVAKSAHIRTAIGQAARKMISH